MQFPFVKVPTKDLLLGPAPIDWCEANLPSINAFSIEEYHNTWTNISYVIVGIVLFMEYRATVPSIQLDPIFAYCFTSSVVLTGITSGWFHATLIYIAQKSDEIFENVAVLSLMYFHVMRKSSSRTSSKRYAIFFVHVVLLALGVLTIPEVFCEVHLITIVLLCFRSALASTKTLTDARIKQRIASKFNRSFVAAGVSFSLWIVDFAFCTPLVASFNLHAYCWHFGTALALYWGGQASMELGKEMYAMDKREKYSTMESSLGSTTGRGHSK